MFRVRDSALRVLRAFGDCRRSYQTSRSARRVSNRDTAGQRHPILCRFCPYFEPTLFPCTKYAVSLVNDDGRETLVRCHAYGERLQLKL